MRFIIPYVVSLSPCRFPGRLLNPNGTTNMQDFLRRPFALHPRYLSTHLPTGEHGSQPRNPLLLS